MNLVERALFSHLQSRHKVEVEQSDEKVPRDEKIEIKMEKKLRIKSEVKQQAKKIKIEGEKTLLRIL
jgi:hypothetical protein